MTKKEFRLDEKSKTLGLWEWDLKKAKATLLTKNSDIKQAIKLFTNEDWALFMRYLDGEIQFLELVHLRIELIKKIMGDKLI